MINKRSIWFLTLFSLILVLSVYYITMPTELLLTSKEEEGSKKVIVEEATILTALRIESDEEMVKEVDDLTKILTDISSSIEDKNTAFEKIKGLNIIRGEEESIEKEILNTYNLKSFVKISNDQIRVIIASTEHNEQLANDIMRLIQDMYHNKMYISVKFQSS